MKDATIYLIDFLAENDQFFEADLFTITLITGEIFYWTSADRDVHWNGHTFSSKGPQIQRSNIKWQLGLQVDELEVKLGYGSMINPVTFDGPPVLII